MSEQLAISLTWTEVGAIAAGMVAAAAFIVAALRGVFLTEKKHDLLCRAVQGRTCSKIDEIKRQLDTMERRREEAKDLQQRRQLWLGQTMQRLADKLGVEISEMP